MDGYGAYIENFAANCTETNYTVNFAENYLESGMARLIWRFGHHKE
jgi:hypothetical protein